MNWIGTDLPKGQTKAHLWSSLGKAETAQEAVRNYFTKGKIGSWNDTLAEEGEITLLVGESTDNLVGVRITSIEVITVKRIESPFEIRAGF